MYLKLFALSLLSAISYAYTSISVHEVKLIVNSINSVRKEIDTGGMLQVSWNSSLQDALNTYVTTINPYSLFNLSINPYTGNFTYNILTLMENPNFVQFKNSGWRGLFHDTCQNSELSVLRIIHLRIRQQSCFNYSACNSSVFTNYETCTKLKTSQFRKNSSPCSWFNAYYPQMLWPDIYQIACFLTGIPGPNTPNHQPNSFGCFARDLFKYHPTNNLPYISGTKCTSCPKQFPKCDGLCE